MAEDKPVKKVVPGYGNYGYGQVTGGAGQIAWGEVLYGLKKRVWLVVLGVLVGGLTGYFYLRRSPVVYEAETVLITEPHKKVMKIDEIESADLSTQQELNTFLQIIQSRTVLAQAAQSVKSSDKALFGQMSETEILGQMMGGVSVSPRPGTRFIVVSMEQSDPEMARSLANGVAQEAVKFTQQQGTSATKGANEFLVAEIERQREKLTSSELALSKYVRENDKYFPGGSLTAITDQHESLSKRLEAATEEISLVASDLKRAKELGESPKELVKLPSVAKDQAVAAVLTNLSEKKAELEQLSRRYLEKHPKHIACRLEIDRLERQLNQNILAAVHNLDIAFEQASHRESDLAAGLKTLEPLLFEAKNKLGEVSALQRDIETNKTVFESVLSRLKETDLSKGLQQTPLAVYEPAVAPRVPVRPIPQKILVTGLVAGLLVGLALAICLNLLDSSIKTVNEAEELTGKSVLCVVPARKETKTKKARKDESGKEAKALTGLDAIDTPHGQIAESFRTLRAGLSLLGPAEEHRKFLFTSAFPSEGKSFCCANFAVTLAGQGLKTLIIDADLRKPTISTLFYRQRRSPGLSEHLAGQAAFEDTVYSTSIANLFTVPAGGRSPNPAELLGSPKFKEFIEQALKSFDRVVIDTAPVIAVSDTLLIVPHVDTACMVVWGSKTPRSAVTRGVKLLGNAKAPLAGLVLNKLPVRKGSYYNYYYYYTGYYGTEGVYGATSKGTA